MSDFDSVSDKSAPGNPVGPILAASKQVIVNWADGSPPVVSPHGGQAPITAAPNDIPVSMQPEGCPMFESVSEAGFSRRFPAVLASIIAERLRAHAKQPIPTAKFCDAASAAADEIDRLRAWLAWMAVDDEHAQRALDGDPAPTP